MPGKMSEVFVETGGIAVNLEGACVLSVCD